MKDLIPPLVPGAVPLGARNSGIMPVVEFIKRYENTEHKRIEIRYSPPPVDWDRNF